MGLTRIKVILRKKKGQKEGYLKIRTTANRQSTYKTLGLKIENTHWNSEKGEVRESHPDHESLNEFIAEELRKHHIYGRIPTYVIGGSKEILIYFLQNIENTSNPGTKNVKRATYKKLKAYLIDTKNSSLKLGNLSADHIQVFYNFLLKEVSANTASHHVKILKIIINRAVRDGLTSPYLINPFGTVKLKYVEPKVKSLTELQLKVLQQENHFRPNKYLSMFLFSIFAQGMRKSDVLLLRWQNLHYTYDKVLLDYTVRKTQEPRNVTLTQMAVYYLRLQLFDYAPQLKTICEDLEENLERQREKIRDYTSAWNYWSRESKAEKDSLVLTLLREGKTLQQAEQHIYSEGEKSKRNLDYHTAIAQENEFKLYDLCGRVIQELSINEPQQFVFDCLRGQKISKYWQSDEEFKILDNKAKLYNYHLRKIGEKQDIKGLAPHKARHTFLQFVSDAGTDLQTIQSLAGHKDPKQTKSYLRRLKTDTGEKADHDFSERFKDYN